MHTALGCISKPNPRNSHWGIMKLYLKKQVVALALKRFGTLDAVHQEVRRQFHGLLASMVLHPCALARRRCCCVCGCETRLYRPFSLRPVACPAIEALGEAL
jgi:hypothetical protein